MRSNQGALETTPERLFAKPQLKGSQLLFVAVGQKTGMSRKLSRTIGESSGQADTNLCVHTAETSLVSRRRASQTCCGT